MEKKSLNTFTLIAAVLMALTTLVHLFVGEADIHQPVRASALNADVIATVSVVWHFVSVHLALTTVALFWLSWRRNRGVQMILFAHVVGITVLFLSYGIFDVGSLWIMPQWSVFLLIALLMLPGLRGRG